MPQTDSKGDAMDAKLVVNNVPLVIPTHFTIGSFTTGNFQPPQGEVMKLSIPTLSGTQTETPTEPAFGTHLREAVAIVKDWQRHP
jgi:hypothetical protein